METTLENGVEAIKTIRALEYVTTSTYEAQEIWEELNESEQDELIEQFVKLKARIH